MSPRGATVLVTAAGSAPAQAFIRGLRGQDELAVRLVGVDGSAYAGGLFDCDAAYTVPRVDAPAFLDAIAGICVAQGVDVIAPIGNFELEFFAGAAQALRARCGVTVITNSPQTVALAQDKHASARRVAAHGVAVPAYHDPATPQALRYPVIVKPTVGAGSHGVTVVHRAEDLAGALREAGRAPLVQDYVAGQEYTVDLVVAPDGEVLAVAPRIRVEVRAGQSYKGVTVDDPEVQEAARRCVGALGLTAQGNVQLIKADRDGRCYFIEVNPKFAAAMGLTIGAGLNIPLLYVKLALGIAPRPEELRRAPRMWLLRSWSDRVVSEAAIEAVPGWESAAPAPSAG